MAGAKKRYGAVPAKVIPDLALTCSVTHHDFAGSTIATELENEQANTKEDRILSTVVSQTKILFFPSMTFPFCVSVLQRSWATDPSPVPRARVVGGGTTSQRSVFNSYG